ncbi:MAG: DNA-binding response regulator [Anaerolineales bacterium]|nr:DNA-binding response regulator [Anaerolineales bacterium]
MKQILFADNTPDFLITRAEFLEKQGYRVQKAFTFIEAKRLLTEAYFHLAILDIRMQNDDDEKDVSGLTLAKDPAYRSIPKIILTSYPTVEAVKEALGPVLEGLPPAVNFISKKDEYQAMIDAVDDAFAQFVRINWDLGIQWDPREPLSFPHLVNLMQPDLSIDILIHRASELEDLVRQLFYKFKLIRFGRLLWHNRQRFSLPVMTLSHDGVTDLRILICGDRKLLTLEKLQMEKLTPEVAQGTQLRDYSETMNFSALLYGLPGANIETVQTLHDLLQLGKKEPLKAAFTNMLGNVLKAWHSHGQMVQGSDDLMSIYRQWVDLNEESLPRVNVEQRVESLIQSVRTLGAIEVKRNKDQIIFNFPHQAAQSFPDPLAIVYAPLVQYDAPVVCRVSPGILTADNVLVDSERRTWLTDFLHANQAPQWWDYVCLEAIIRFDSNQAPDLLACLEFEECLVKSAQLDEKLDQGNVIPELRMNIELIEQIRRQASIETGSDPLPYYAGLLAWTVGAIARYDPGVLSTQVDNQRGAHLLLGAAMLAKRLGTVTDTSQPEGRLRLEEDGRVWIGEHRVTTLTGLRLKLLRCLYEREGQAVSNRTIVENAYSEKYDAADFSQNQRIRQEIRRLREEIEPDPKRPRYILTVRERGYRLQASGELEE